MKISNSLKMFLCMAVCFGLWSCQQIPPYQNETGAEVLKLKYKGRELPQEVVVHDVDLEQNPEYAMGITIKITRLSGKVYRTEYDLADKQTGSTQQIGELVFPNWSNLGFLSFEVNEMLAFRTGHTFWARGTPKGVDELSYPVVFYVGVSNEDAKSYSEQFGFKEQIDWHDNENPYQKGMMKVGIKQLSFRSDYIPSVLSPK